jgi:hypothetical protein
MLGNEDKVAWLTPHVAVTRAYERMLHFWQELPRLCYFSLSADGNEINVFARSHEH